jgi:hypothetical protein
MRVMVGGREGGGGCLGQGCRGFFVFVTISWESLVVHFLSFFMKTQNIYYRFTRHLMAIIFIPD